MPSIVDLRTASDLRDVVHKTVQTLAEGGLVGLPTETGYIAVANPLHAPSIDRLQSLGRRIEHPRVVLAMKSSLEALDYVPQVGSLGKKLLRRFWPGPVTIQFERQSSFGLADAFSESVQKALLGEANLSMRLPAHEFTWNVQRLLPAPLVFTDDSSMSGTTIRTAAQFAELAENDIALVIDAGDPRHELPTSLVSVDGDSWKMIREGAATRRTLTRLAGNVVLFVCTGNTCRSPMAEGLYRKLLAQRLNCPEEDLVDRGHMILSAGVAADDGQPSSPEAVEILSARGIDISTHESQQLTPQ